jgi:medium-chain acyl-[acyl-carrier-protein] hydrolase
MPSTRMPAGPRDPSSPWLARRTPNPRALFRLFCFPYAGGGSLAFHDWPRWLPSWVDVCPIELPGRGARIAEPLMSAIAPMVRLIAPAIAPHLDRPFGFFGHSMGAAIAFELTRELRRLGQRQPELVIVSGRRAPQLPPEGDPAHRLSALPDAEFLEEVRRLRGTPPEVFEHAELVQLFMPILRADFALCREYAFTPEPPLSCALSAYGGERDEVTHEAFEAWRELTTGPFTLRKFPGDHFYVNTDRALFLPAIGRDIEAAMPKGSPAPRVAANLPTDHLAIRVFPAPS